MIENLLFSSHHYHDCRIRKNRFRQYISLIDGAEWRSESRKIVKKLNIYFAIKLCCPNLRYVPSLELTNGIKPSQQIRFQSSVKCDQFECPDRASLRHVSSLVSARWEARGSVSPLAWRDSWEEVKLLTYPAPRITGSYCWYSESILNQQPPLVPRPYLIE